ncbi:MAG: DUF945 domain-containing protein [Acholeplasmatales bacterium]|nr:DUF945 domain-containing protein [Methanobrevibacter sp.]MBP5446457.1 DUF945 domain-containing protein [Acholeplasmatales bacterium]
MSKYTVNGFPWSHGIGVDVSDCTTSKEVMEKAGLNFTVEKCELYAKMPFNLNGSNIIDTRNGEFAQSGNIYRPCPNGYATYRTDENIPLGVVKDKYEVVQNVDAFNFFNDAIGPDKAIWQYAGMFGYGQRIFVSAKIPVSFDVNHDPVDNYLVFSNSHDGSCSINILFTPVRVFCTNCLNAAFNKADSYIRLRHTKTIKERLQQGSEILKIACNYAEDAKQLYEALANIKVSDEQVMKYLADLNLTEAEITQLNLFDEKNGYKKLYARDYLTMERTGISTRKINQIVNMFEYYMDGVGQKEIAGTSWGAYNAVTGFYSNVANLSGTKRMDSILYGNANNVMNKALNQAYELINAA